MKDDLIKSVLDKDEEKVKELLNQNNIEMLNHQDKSGFTALHYAVQDNLFNIAVLLIEKGADLELQDKWGNSVLLRAESSFRGDGRIISLLLEKGADINKKNFYGQSPIEVARIVANYDLLSLFKNYI